MQQKPQNRPDGSLRRGDQCSGPRDAMAMVAPHRDPRCDNQTAAALIRRPVSHARGGVFLLFCAESTGTSAFAALPVAACSDQLGAGTFFARHVTIAGRSAGGIVSGFEPRGARLFFCAMGGTGCPHRQDPSGSDATGIEVQCDAQASACCRASTRGPATAGSDGPTGRAGSIPASRTFFARRVAGHQLAGVGVVVADDAQGIGRMAGAGFRGGHGIHSHTAQATRRAEGESRASVSGNEGLSCLRHLTRARPVRRIPNSPFSLPLALDAAASGRGARIFFQVNA